MSLTSIFSSPFQRFSSLSLFAIAVSLLFFSETARAQIDAEQPASEHRLGFEIGGGISSFREDLIVPLVFSGPNLSLGGIYSHKTDTKQLFVNLRFGLGHLDNRYSHESWEMRIEATSSWVTKLHGQNKYGDIWGGAFARLQLNNLFVESWDDAHLYWLTAHSMGGSIQWGKKLSKKYTATVGLEVPLISWVARPPAYRYSKQDPVNHLTYHFSGPNKKLHFELIDAYRAISLKIHASRELKGVLVSLSYEFDYGYFDKPEKIEMMNNFIVFSFLWKVGS
jgi:hypothetical protein